MKKLKIAWITGDYFIDVDFMLVPYMKDYYKDKIDISWTVIKSHNSNIQIDGGLEFKTSEQRSQCNRRILSYHQTIERNC